MIDYDPHHWRDHFFDIKGSMVRQIFYRVLSCMIWSVAVVLCHHRYSPVNISDKAHLITGTALGLLLVFRTTASYERFWEGRKLWGSIINETRNLGRAAGVLLADAPDLLRNVLGWTTSFAYSTMHSLRGRRGLGPPGDWLPVEEVQLTRKASQEPLAVARRISEHFAEARRRRLISDYVQMQLDQNVQLLVDYMGGCERIARTPLPFAYMVHLRRALSLYCFTLPFALVDAFGWSTILVTFFISYILFGIEEIGVEIENPFGQDDNDLPIETFCARIENDLLSILDTMPAGKGSETPIAKP